MFWTATNISCLHFLHSSFSGHLLLPLPPAQEQKCMATSWNRIGTHRLVTTTGLGAHLPGGRSKEDCASGWHNPFQSSQMRGESIPVHHPLSWCSMCLSQCLASFAGWCRGCGDKALLFYAPLGVIYILGGIMKEQLGCVSPLMSGAQGGETALPSFLYTYTAARQNLALRS